MTSYLWQSVRGTITALKNIANGIAGLNESAKVPDSLLEFPVDTHAALTASHGQATIEGIAGSQAKVDAHAALAASHGRTNIDGVVERDAAVATHAALAASHGRTNIDGVAERDAAVATHAVLTNVHNLPLFSVQNVVTATRAINTVYQNTTGKPMIILVTLSNVAADAITVRTDSANPPITLTAGLNIPAGGRLEICFMVMVNFYYRLLCTDSTIDFWTEYS